MIADIHPLNECLFFYHDLNMVIGWRRTLAMLFKIGCVTGIRYVSWAYGNTFIIQISNTSNSRQLSGRLASIESLSC